MRGMNPSDGLATSTKTGTSEAVDPVLRSLLALHKELQSTRMECTGLAARMESHQQSLLKTMKGVERQAEGGGAQTEEIVREFPDASTRGRRFRADRASGPEVAPQAAGAGGDADAQEPAAPAEDREPAPGRRQSYFTMIPQRFKKTRLPRGLSSVTRATSGKRLSDVQRQLSQHRTTITERLSHAKTPEHHWSKRWATNLSSRWEFETLVSMSIFLNALSIGVSCEWGLQNPSSSLPLVFVILDWVFLAICAFELVLRMFVQGRRFWYLRDRMFSWNMFDLSVIVLILLNELSLFDLRLSVVRVFRVLRLVYVVRVVRVMPWFEELRLMIDGIMKCGKTLLWSSIILLFFTYVYAIVCVQLSADWSSMANDASEPTHATILFLQENFPSLGYSIYTLFKAVTGGVSWGEVSDPLQDVSLAFLFSFPVYIVVTMFCVLNIITAAFVEAASRKSQDAEEAALRNIIQRTIWIDAIKSIVAKFDHDNDDTLNWAEFSQIMNDWETRAPLEDMGIDMTFQRASLLFKLFDWNQDGHIDVDEFAQGVHHLKGAARSLDMYRQFVELSRKISSLQRMVEQLSATSGAGQPRNSRIFGSDRRSSLPETPASEACDSC